MFFKMLILLGNLVPVLLFSEYKWSTIRHLERIDDALFICLLYKLLTGSKDSNDLSIGYYESNGGRKLEMTDDKEAPNKGRFHVKNFSKDAFGYVERQENGTYGLGSNQSIVSLML